MKTNTSRKEEGTISKANIAAFDGKTFLQKRSIETKLTPEQYGQLISLLNKQLAATAHQILALPVFLLNIVQLGSLKVVHWTIFALTFLYLIITRF